MNKAINQKRTKLFGLGLIRLVDDLPAGKTADTIGAQLLRSGNTVGAKYRAAVNAFTKKEALAQLRVAHERADESLYLMEMLVESRAIGDERIRPLMTEAEALVKILRDEIIELQGEIVQGS
ncbi:MAG TPA: four helix bundle protein [Anaerolineales bacterium]|nr:four helix bundle protein [Anaerolineales bacterium]